MDDLEKVEVIDPPPAEQALQLARTLGELIRTTADNHLDRREAVDNLLIVLERSAGLRF